MSAQPEWKLVAQLGDANPIEYGGYFVYVDETGVYPPEAELLDAPDCDEKQRWNVYRFILEPCTFINGILSDNRFHPDKPAWFADRLHAVAGYCDFDMEEMISALTGNDIKAKAWAWKAIGEYHGMNNLDDYPLTFNRAEVEARYAEELAKH